jgi:hypothetical protein
MKAFKEVQRFNQWWLWIILCIPVLVLIMEMVEVFRSTETNTTQRLVMLGVVLVFSLLTFLWMRLLKLETTIEGDVIKAHFKGLPFAKRNIQRNEIEKMEVVTYEPLFEYGGWGVRYSLRKRGWCYNVSGDKGLLITYKNGKTFLIGTQKPDELKLATTDKN